MRARTQATLAGAAVIAILALAACGDDEGSGESETSAAETTSSSATTAEETTTVADEEFLAELESICAETRKELSVDSSPAEAAQLFKKQVKELKQLEPPAEASKALKQYTDAQAELAEINERFAAGELAPAEYLPEQQKVLEKRSAAIEAGELPAKCV